MNLNTSTMVSIANGVGELEFPHALKRDLLMSTIQCQSLYIDANPAAKNEGLLIVCDCSYYITQNGMAKKNILAMFQNKKSVNIVYFPNHITLTTIMSIELITKFQFKWANTYNMLNRYDTFY